MRISREVLYLVGGSALLMATPVLQIVRENLSSLIWHDVRDTFLVVVGIQSLLIAVLALLLPNRLYIAAAMALAIWLPAYHIEMHALLKLLNINVFQLIVVLPPALLICLALLPQEFIARVIGTTGLALFATAAIQFFQTDDLARLLPPIVDPMIMLDKKPLPKPVMTERRLPDIIYIVPDRYGSATVLAHEFQHNNDEFLNALRLRGFAVADKARANYLKTHYSLASSMNMQYLQPLLQSLDGKILFFQPLHSLIQDNLVTARLKQMGYRYVHVPNWWDGSRLSKQADITANFWGGVSFGGEFGRAVLKRSPYIMWANETIYRTNPCAALTQQLAYLEDAGGDDLPTFVFAHLLAPHSPIIMNAEGRCIDPIEYFGRPTDATWDDFKKAYSGFVSYLDKRLLKIFDRQKANNLNPIIFVLQADEGPFPKAYRETVELKHGRDDGPDGQQFDWREASDAQLAMKFGILNALYLGDPDDAGGLPDVPETLTPVNNWRVIFNRLEGKAYPLLPDRFFIFPNSAHPYTSIEITEHLNAIP